MSDERTPDEREAIAVHEAGHAVVAEQFGITVIRASIVPNSTSEGRVLHGFENVRFPSEAWRREPGVVPPDVLGSARRHLGISVAGNEAHAYLVAVPGDPWRSVSLWGDELDHQQQEKLLASLILDDWGFEPHRESIGYRRDQLLNEARHLARTIIEEQWDTVTKLADQLLDRNELSGDEVRGIIS
jgi:hypothetical protein